MSPSALSLGCAGAVLEAVASDSDLMHGGAVSVRFGELAPVFYRVPARVVDRLHAYLREAEGLVLESDLEALRLRARGA